MAQLINQLNIGDGSYEFNAKQLGGKAPEEFATSSDLTAAVNKLNSLIASALEYKGSLLSSTSTTGYTPAATKGDVYVVAVAGTVNGIRCEAGDLWLCNATSVGAGSADNAATVNKSWDVVQSNIDMETLRSEFAYDKHSHAFTAKGTVTPTSVTPKGTVSQPTFTGTAQGHTHTVASHSSHTFTGTGVELVATYTGSSNSSSGSFTPSGTISTISHTPAGSVAVEAVNPTTGETPEIYSAEGTTGSSGAHSHTTSASYTPAGSVTIEKGTGTANYTPAGSVSSSGAHTHNVDVSIDYTPVGSIASNGAHTHSVSSSGAYTPAGSVSGHTHSISVGSAKAVTGVSGALTASYDETTKTLTLGSALNVSTASFAQTVSTATGSTAPTFTGTKATISVTGTAASAGGHSHTFTGTKTTLSQTATAASAGGHNHAFTGSGVELVGKFTGTQTTITGATNSAGAHTHTFKGAGKMLTGTFTGTAFSVTPTFSGKAATVNVSGTSKGTIKISTGTGTANYTPSGTISTTGATLTTSNTSITPKGTVSQPTFTGTAQSHSHNFTGTETYTKEGERTGTSPT